MVAKTTLFVCNFHIVSHSPLQNGLVHGMIVLGLIIIYDEGKKFYDAEQEICIT